MGPMLLDRLRLACERRTADGLCTCDVHQISNRCLTCQAAAVIERYDKWFNENAVQLANHRIGGYEFRG